ncbi:MAG: sarcosine oxidase, gamma subunit family protein [Rhodobacteraceae bacterium]|nr:sarcosine oxidase, gamma subunit family protein [Paracoccaceae bacterium]
MSEAVSALNGAEFNGAVRISEAGLLGMITLRGDLEDAKLAAAVKAAVGLAMPAKRGVRDGKKGSVAWMSPDELLLMLPYAGADQTVARLDKSLEGVHHLAVNVSDARAVFHLEGRGLREVIAKGSPADLSSMGLPVGEVRRTRLGQVAVAFWLSDEDHLTLICFRSVGAHVFAWLKNAAAEGTLPEFLG